MNLPYLQLLVLHNKVSSLQKPHCATIVLYFVFWIFAMNCESQEFNLIKIP